MPLATENLAVILVWRGAFGFGTGLISPLIMPLALASAENPQAARRQMGSNAICMNVGAIVFQMLGGWVCTNYGWRAVFWVHLLIVPCLLIILFVFPDRPAEPAAPAAKTFLSAAELRPVVKWFAVNFVYMVLFYALVTRTASVIQEQNFGTANTAGIVLSIFTVGGVCGGFLYRGVFSKADRWVFPILFSLMACGFVVMAFCPNLTVLSAGELIVGLGFGMFNPAIGTSTGYASDDACRLTASSLLAVFSSMGGFLSAYILTGLSTLFGFAHSRSVFLICSAAYALLAAVFLLFRRVFFVPKPAET